MEGHCQAQAGPSVGSEKAHCNGAGLCHLLQGPRDRRQPSVTPLECLHCGEECFPRGLALQELGKEPLLAKDTNGYLRGSDQGPEQSSRGSEDLLEMTIKNHPLTTLQGTCPPTPSSFRAGALAVLVTRTRQRSKSKHLAAVFRGLFPAGDFMNAWPK